MKKYVSLFIVSVICAAMLVGCGSKSKTDNAAGTEIAAKNSSEPARDKYVKMAKEANAKMPMVVPGGLRMDKFEAVSKNELKYYYTFTQEPVVSAEEFVRSSKPALTLGLQTMKDPEIDMFRKDKMTLIYSYYKLDGTLFAEIKVSPEEYK